MHIYYLILQVYLKLNQCTYGLLHSKQMGSSKSCFGYFPYLIVNTTGKIYKVKKIRQKIERHKAFTISRFSSGGRGTLVPSRDNSPTQT